MSSLPSLFVSHGAPTLILEDVPARRFLASYGATLPRPDAIVAVSAHDIARGVTVGTAAMHTTVHDFHGFPASLYAMRYEPPGDPALAGDVIELLRKGGLPVNATDEPGIDHGTWVPLKLMFPGADIPVVPVSLDVTMDEREHVAIGRALAPLRRRNVLVLASGGFTHNLREFGRFGRDDPPAPYVAAFREWMADALARADEASLLGWKTHAPHALRAHPSPDHLMPLFVAFGAGGEHPSATRLHDSVNYGMLAMDAFAFQ